MTATRTGTKQGALHGVRVLDLTRFYSGPFATLMLAGFGAEVIRIDAPEQGDPTMTGPPFLGKDGVSLDRQHDSDLGLAYLKRCRDKKSITLNMRSAEGMELFNALLRKSDILVENLRPGAAERLGIDYAANRQVNPAIVHCALTGYGSTGADRRLKAYDLMIQAASGLMSITGAPDSAPSKAGTALADGITGAFAVSGILAALTEQRISGQGQFVDVAMADCLLSLVLDEPLDCYKQMGMAPRQGNRIMRFSPFNTYPTRDGAIALGAATNEDWLLLLRVMDRLDLASDEKFMNTGWRVSNNAVIDAIVTEWSRGRTTAEAIEALNKGDVAASPIRDIDDILAWEHLGARDMLQAVEHPTEALEQRVIGAGFPIKMGRTHKGYTAPAPTLGQNNAEIYGGLLGLSGSRIAELKARQVI
ncbi:CoA transferase [Bradyrhizobium sp. Arg68]|uniref:CaiB/BaiF CoA transferase family protein n=1 Tax=Bradyrhizobium ivorense TaxID=2511166 RepID=UPI001E399CAC|nr:CoA transferase [Bradyrhizobium ivorense]MCC8936648.1 CoA transferase [Bradyrhizobium ivorense]